jgi:hypothetical protein
MKTIITKIAVVAAALLLALPVSADVLDLYQIGSNPGGNALDPGGNNIGGIPVISWTDTIVGAPSGIYMLSILAEASTAAPARPAGANTTVSTSMAHSSAC